MEPTLEAAVAAIDAVYKRNEQIEIDRKLEEIRQSILENNECVRVRVQYEVASRKQEEADKSKSKGMADY